jgi:adenine deaminase
MKSFTGILVFNSAYRRFEYGTVLFDRHITDVAFSAMPDFRTASGGKASYLIPGFIDIHMHIESSMTTPTEFSNISARHGTTTFVSDCHEITNAAGIAGLKAFMDFPVLTDVFYAIPSSVPAADSHIETANGYIDSNEVEILCNDPRILALGEIMNTHDLISSSQNRTKRVISTFKKYRPAAPVEGHCPSLTGSDLSAFIAAGVDSDHTQQTPASLTEKTGKGMFLEIQYKSINTDTARSLSAPELAGKFCFCTDDVMPDTLYEQGQLDNVLRYAIDCGMKPEEVIFAATYTPAQRMRLYDRGIIAPGKISDFIILDDLKTLSIKEVWKKGEKIYDRDAKISRTLPVPEIPDLFRNSIKRDPVSADDFTIAAADGVHESLIIRRNTGTSTATVAVKHRLRAENGRIIIEDGLNLIASVERYGHNEPIKPAILENGLTIPGALCSSWAHDSHNLLVLATDAELAAQAVNLVIRNGGGIAAVDPDADFFIPLACAGIVSLEPVKILAGKIKKLREWLRSHGYNAKEEIMNFAVLALPVSPEIRITCKGLVLVREQKIADWLDYRGNI